MTEERKASLLERFLAEELTETEKVELKGAMETDREFAAQVSFNLKLTAAMHEERMSALKTARKQERRKRNILRSVGGVLILLLLSVLFFWFVRSQPTLPFTPQEGVELMNNVVATAANKEDVAVVAGGNWRNDLVAGAQVQGKYEEALASLINELDQRGYCQDYQLDFYAGMLELYINRSPERAAPFLECLKGKSIKRYSDELKLPLILLRLAQGKDAEAAALFNASGLSYAVLPAAAEDRIMAINQ